MATTFKNKNIVQVGTVPVEVLETTEIFQRATIVGLSLTNPTDSFVYVTVLVDDDTSVQGSFYERCVVTR